jgi:hypothetical protein
MCAQLGGGGSNRAMTARSPRTSNEQHDRQSNPKRRAMSACAQEGNVRFDHVASRIVNADHGIV